MRGRDWLEGNRVGITSFVLCFCEPLFSTYYLDL